MKKQKRFLENLPPIMMVTALLIYWYNYYKLKQLEFHIEIIVLILFFTSFIISLYCDVKNVQYTTRIPIIIAGVVEILVLIAFGYFYYKRIDKESSELLWDRSMNISRCGYVLIIMSSIKSLLKSKRFEKSKINNKMDDLDEIL